MSSGMKKSGIDWIGEIPNDWNTSILKKCLLEINDSNNPIKTKNVLSLTNKLGVVPYEDKGNQGNKAKEDYSGYKLAYENTIVANSMNVLIGSVGISKYYGCVSPVYYVFRSKGNADLRYINYIFQNVGFQKELRKYAKGIMEIRLRVSAHDILRRIIPFPNVSTQTRIANYLDKVCEDINNVIANTEHSIEEYKSLKQSIIAEAISKGIRGNSRETKDSGISWIGKIPSNWEVKKGKHVLKYLERPVLDTDEVITCFRDGEVTLRSNRREDGFTFSMQETGYQGIEPGDLVVHGMDGFAGAIGISDSRGKGTPVLNVLGSSEDKKFIMYYLRNMAYGGIFIALSTGIRVRSCDTNWNKLKELPFVIPPKDEQKEISDYIDDKCRSIDALILSKTNFLAELEKYKKSIIYEYVTGKKEVPEL